MTNSISLNVNIINKSIIAFGLSNKFEAIFHTSNFIEGVMGIYKKV